MIAVGVAAYGSIKQLLFEGRASNLQGKFDNLPFTQREAIEKTIPAILSNRTLKSNVQKAIEILHEKNESGGQGGGQKFDGTIPLDGSKADRLNAIKQKFLKE